MAVAVFKITLKDNSTIAANLLGMHKLLAKYSRLKLQSR